MPTPTDHDSTLAQTIELTDNFTRQGEHPGAIASALISCAIVILMKSAMPPYQIRKLINDTIDAAFNYRPHH